MMGGNHSLSSIDNHQAEVSLDAGITVIIPVRNEAESIEALFKGLNEQTVRPNEIVIVDGGSEDATVDLIRKFAAQLSLPVKLLEIMPSFPGKARNVAISEAAHEWVATIDAGTVPDKDWLQELIAAAKTNPQARVIYGKYLPVSDTHFSRCAAITYVPPPHTFSPSTASSLIHRSAWKEVQGFREDLRSGEDLLFFKLIAERQIPRASTSKAIVHWSLESSWAGTFRRFATYSRYGMKAGLAQEWQVRVALLYLIFLGLIVGGIMFSWPLVVLPIVLLVLRTGRRIWSWHAGRNNRWELIFNLRLVATVLAINLLIDLAMFWGMLQWVVSDLVSNRTRGGVLCLVLVVGLAF